MAAITRLAAAEATRDFEVARKDMAGSLNRFAAIADQLRCSFRDMKLQLGGHAPQPEQTPRLLNAA